MGLKGARIAELCEYVVALKALLRGEEATCPARVAVALTSRPFVSPQLPVSTGRRKVVRFFIKMVVKHYIYIY